MELFDGYIAAIATEFNIKFKKESDGHYSTIIEFENNRKQSISITLSKDESGDRMIHYHSMISKIGKDSMQLYKKSLQINCNLDYGAIVLDNNKLMLRSSILLHHCEPQRFMKNLIYIAAKADELEEKFTHKDKF
jgi:ribosomal protein S8